MNMHDCMTHVKIYGILQAKLKDIRGVQIKTLNFVDVSYPKWTNQFQSHQNQDMNIQNLIKKTYCLVQSSFPSWWIYYRLPFLFKTNPHVFHVKKPPFKDHRWKFFMCENAPGFHADLHKATVVSLPLCDLPTMSSSNVHLRRCKEHVQSKGDLAQ